MKFFNKLSSIMNKQTKIHIVIDVVVIGSLLTVLLMQKEIPGKILFSQITVLYGIISTAISAKYNKETVRFRIFVAMAIVSSINLVNTILTFY